MTGQVDFQRDGMVATITLNRPDKLNAVTLEMARMLEKIEAECNGDPEIRAVVLTGAGDRAFCCGTDVKQSDQFTDAWSFRNREDYCKSIRQTVKHVYIRAPYGTFQTADGYIIVAFPPLEKFGDLIGEPAFKGLQDEVDSWTQRDMIFAKTRERLKTRKSQEWLDLFARHDIWAGPVYGYADLADDPQIKHNGTFVEYDHPTEGHVKTPGFAIRFSKTPSSVRTGAPQAGQHSRDILAEFGFDEGQFKELISNGTVFSGTE